MCRVAALFGRHGREGPGLWGGGGTELATATGQSIYAAAADIRNQGPCTTMNAPVASIHELSSLTPPAAVNVDRLIVELDYQRRKAEQLALMNELHARLARAIDLPGMIEAFSVWLLPHVEHELIAYHNPARGRSHFFCSCHGPLRRQVMRIATEAVRGGGGKGGKIEGFSIYRWRLESRPGDQDVVALVCQRPLDRASLSLVHDALDVLREPLRRALDYEDLFEMANHDALTGLANRRVFEERIGPLMDSARRHGRPLAVAALDLDHFKEVNDHLGHGEGDRVLQQVAAVMRRTVRSSDLLVRMGGDEFLLVLPETTIGAARVLAERLVRRIGELGIEAGGRRLGVSIGLVAWEPGMSKEELLQRADETLYRAKAAGRNRVAVAAFRRSSRSRRSRRSRTGRSS